MKKVRLIAVTAVVAFGAMLAATGSAAAMPMAVSSSPGDANLILVQERGARTHQDWGHGDRYWHDRGRHNGWNNGWHNRRYYDRSNWHNRRYYRRDWYDDRYYHRRYYGPGIILNFGY